MHRPFLVLILGFSTLVLLPVGAAATPQESAKIQGSAPSPAVGTANLKICLRLQDESPFSGAADLRVHRSQGSDLAGTKSESDGETLFSNLLPGTYSIEASSPGFDSVKQTIEIESGNRTQTVFLILKPEGSAPVATSATVPDTKTVSTSAPAPAAAANNLFWIPAGVDASIPKVRPGVSCSMPRVLEGTGERMKQLVVAKDSWPRVRALARVDHGAGRVNGSGGDEHADRRPAERRR